MARRNRIWQSDNISFTSKFKLHKSLVTSMAVKQDLLNLKKKEEKKGAWLFKPNAWGIISASLTWSTRPMTGCRARSARSLLPVQRVDHSATFQGSGQEKQQQQQYTQHKNKNTTTKNVFVFDSSLVYVPLDTQASGVHLFLYCSGNKFQKVTEPMCLLIGWWILKHYVHTSIHNWADCWAELADSIISALLPFLSHVTSDCMAEASKPVSWTGSNSVNIFGWVVFYEVARFTRNWNRDVRGL